MDAMREVTEEAFEESGSGVGIAFGMDFQIDVAGGAIDGDEGVTLALLQGRQMLEIDVKEADGGLFEDADRELVGFRPLVEVVALETAMDGAAGEPGIDAAAHHLGDVIERQPEADAQLAHQRLLQEREAGRQTLRSMRAIGNGRAAAPAANGGLAHSKLAGKRRHWRVTALDIRPDLRCRCRVGVQVQVHDARRPLTYAMPRSTPIPSNQSPGTKHAGGA